MNTAGGTTKLHRHLAAIGVGLLGGGDGHAAPGSFGGTYGGYTFARPRIIPEPAEIWFTDQDRGFYVVRSNRAWFVS